MRINNSSYSHPNFKIYTNSIIYMKRASIWVVVAVVVAVIVVIVVVVCILLAVAGFVFDAEGVMIPYQIFSRDEATL